MKSNRSKQAVKPTGDPDWVSREFGGADLSDTRRDARLVGLARALAERPEVSLPQALQDRAALKAAYRFFDNEDVSARDILAPHIASSVECMRGQSVILAVQDTTFIDYAGHRATEGLGPMNDRDGWGLLCHGTLAFTPEGLPLGVLGLRVWARDPKNRGIKATRRLRAIEDKESYKRLDSVQALARLREQLPGTRLMSVADREGDVYEFFTQAQALGVDMLVRAAWDRRVESPQGHVWSTLAKAPLLAQQRLQLPRSPGRAPWVAKLSLRACPITLKPPHNPTGATLESISLWALWAGEMRPPAGVKAIEWMFAQYHTDRLGRAGVRAAAVVYPALGYRNLAPNTQRRLQDRGATTGILRSAAALAQRLCGDCLAHPVCAHARAFCPECIGQRYPGSRRVASLVLPHPLHLDSAGHRPTTATSPALDRALGRIPWAHQRRRAWCPNHMERISRTDRLGQYV